LLKAAELKSVLNEKDFFLMDVHIPEQTHITGTNAFIDYRKIRQNADKLPTDKNGKIVVYCRSGGMSRSAAYDLIDMGYTYVYDLEGGIKAFNVQQAPISDTFVNYSSKGLEYEGSIFY